MSSTKRTTVAAGLVVLLAGCSEAPQGPDAPPLNDHFSSPMVVRAEALGSYVITGLPPIQLKASAVELADGQVLGSFSHFLDEGDGLTVDFHAIVTCVSKDLENGRAWFGGVVKKNNSTDPGFQTPIHQPGQDIWFRVLDTGKNSGIPDRTTFTGFKGAAGFETSAAYCAGKPWPADNARTNPVTGDVIVR